MLLHDLLRAGIARKGLSYRMVEARTGGLVKKSTLTHLLDGRAIFPTDQTIDALSRALGISAGRIRRASRASVKVRSDLWDIARQMKPDDLDEWIDAGRALAAHNRID